MKTNARETLIRPYRINDITQMVEHIAKHVPELPNYQGVAIDKDWLEFFLRRNWNNAAYFQSWLLIDPEDEDKIVGGSGGFCVKGILNPETYAQDAFLFVLPEWRTLANADKLMEAYKKWALARGAVLIQASQVGGYKEEKFTLYMKRRGYLRVGSLYHLRMDSNYLEQQLGELKKGGNDVGT